MRSILFTALFVASALLVCGGGAWADEQEGKGGPPPGKGKFAPAPTPKGQPEPYSTPKGKPEVSPMPKAKSSVPTPPKEEGIGAQVSAWAKSGVRGRQLAAMIHQLQATNAKQTTPKKKPAKPEVTPMPPTKAKKKGKGSEDD